MVAADTALPDTAGWKRFTSRRWGFAFSYPDDAIVRVLGPVDASCASGSDGRAQDEAITEGAAADSVLAVRVSYSRLPFDTIAVQQGFRRLPEGWALAYGDGSELEPPYSHGPLTVISASQQQRTFSDAGGATEQATHTLAVLRRPDGCALVLNFGEIESRGDELQAYLAFRTLELHN